MTKHDLYTQTPNHPLYGYAQLFTDTSNLGDAHHAKISHPHLCMDYFIYTYT